MTNPAGNSEFFFPLYLGEDLDYLEDLGIAPVIWLDVVHKLMFAKIL